VLAMSLKGDPCTALGGGRGADEGEHGCRRSRRCCPGEGDGGCGGCVEEGGGGGDGRARASCSVPRTPRP
jgi:hypothetical protein